MYKVSLNKYSIFSLITSFLLTGCVGFYIPDDYDQSQSEATIKEERIHDSIENYIQQRTPVGYSYHSLEFGDLYVIKDKEIEKLDQLIEQKNQLPLNEEKYGSEYESVEKELQEKINAQKTYLKENKIYPWYEVNHLYSQESVIGDSIIIYEFDFEVYPNYTVKDVHKKMGVSLDSKRYLSLKGFLNQDPVYESDDWQWREEKNAEFYGAAYAALDNETDYKGKLLITLIDMFDYIDLYNSFDENDFAKKQVLKWEKEYIEDALKTISISKLNSNLDSLEGKEVLMGYYMTHDVYTDDIEDKRKYKYYFDLNYVITQVIEEKPAE